MDITNQEYIACIKELKQRYASLSWYKRAWFTLCFYRLSSALSQIDDNNPTTNQVSKLLNVSQNTWFFKSIFNLLSNFKDKIITLNAEQPIPSPLPKIENLRPVEKPPIVEPPKPKQRPSEQKAFIPAAIKRPVQPTIIKKDATDDLITHLKKAKHLLPKAVRHFVNINAANPELSFAYQLHSSLSPDELSELFVVLENKMQHPRIPPSIKHILALLAQGYNESLMNAENLAYLCDEAISCEIGIHDSNIFKALPYLIENNLFTQERLNALRKHPQQDPLFQTILFAGMHYSVNAMTFDMLISSDRLLDLQRFFRRFDFISHRCDRWQKSAYTLEAYQLIAILTPDAPQHYLLSEAARNIIAMIPDPIFTFFFTQQMWQNIYDCCNNPDPEQALRTCVMEMLAAFEEPAERAEPLAVRPSPRLNYSQSTHNTFVEASIISSTQALHQKYNGRLEKESVDYYLNDFANWIDTLPGNNDKKPYQVAKSCFSRIITISFEKADVSIKKLLALAWIAIHDEEYRIGTLKNAKKLLIEGLYEIQRGYNLAVDGNDDGKADNQICVGGTFNKIVEKLNTIIPCIEIQFITQELAGMKLSIVVQEEASSYLSIQANPSTLLNLQLTIALINYIQKNGVDLIWYAIKNTVKNRMFDEFSGLYKQNKDDAQFCQLIDSGIYSESKELSCFQQPIAKSKGYHEYCSQSLKMSGLFALNVSESDEHIVDFNAINNTNN